MTGLLVIDPGLSTTVQDAGRPGYRERGVSPGGAFDRGSADLANALLGNSADCAVLELTLSGGAYQAAGPLALALAGALMEAKVVGPEGSEQSLHIPLCWSLLEGERLILGRAGEGARTYLAVKGGWQTPRCLGSRSSEARLQAGDVLWAEAGFTLKRRLIEPIWESPNVEPFRLIDGPDIGVCPGLDDGFWTTRRFRVGSHSDRMGLRLEGIPVVVASSPERLSSPVAAGAIQLAGNQLIVLGVNCGTLGGYPHLAHVISADHDRLGQLKPGDGIVFRRVTLLDARRIDQLAREARAIFLSQISSVVQ
jgi:5-oxoprolinase (ATP-hydrolysing) subunit C